jgi:uncharacterized C2H2 Zn-finger protein
MEEVTAVDIEVPDDATEYRCPYCDRPFRTERYRTLHLGLDHPDLIDEAEREAFQDAYLEENDEIGRFRLKVLGTLVLVYFLFLFVYLLVN